MGPAPHWHSPLLKQQRCPPPSLQASLVPSFFDSSFSSGVLDRRSTTSGSLPEDAPRDLAGSILHSRSRVSLPRWPFPAAGSFQRIAAMAIARIWILLENPTTQFRRVGGTLLHSALQKCASSTPWGRGSLYRYWGGLSAKFGGRPWIWCF